MYEGEPSSEKKGIGPRNVRERTGTRWGERRLRGTRWDRTGVGGECREVNTAEVEVAIRCTYRIPRAVVAGRDPLLECEWEGGRIDEGGRCGGKGMGKEPERGGVPSEVDPARGPACRVTGTQGTGR